jgi:zinc protease
MVTMVWHPIPPAASDPSGTAVDRLCGQPLQKYAARCAGSTSSDRTGGGGFGSRLMTEVREKRGLTYGVSSGFTSMRVQGPFMISLQTRADVSEGTLKLVKDILRDFLANGPTQKELDDAKRELAGSFPLSTASNSDIVGQLGAIGFYDLPLTYLEDFMNKSQDVTIEQIKEVMNKHLSADKMVIVTAGPTVPQKPLPPPTDRPAEQPLGVPEH